MKVRGLMTNKQRTVVIDGVLYRFCRDCLRLLALTKDNFHADVSRPSGFVFTCHSCASIRSKRYDNANRVIQSERKKLSRKQLRDLISDLKEGAPCMDCGEYYPHYVMEYDHRPDEEKYSNVSQLVKYGSTGLVLREIAKCDLLCANCHRERTFSRLGYLPREPRSMLTVAEQATLHDESAWSDD